VSYNLPKRQLVSHSEHAMTERPDVPRSRFVQSWTRKQTMNAGLVVPFMWDEFLPGDYLKYDTTAMIRMATPIVPLFSNVKADIFYFAIPNRLVWQNWERFMGEQANPGDNIDVVHPFIDFGPADLPVGSIADYLGVPLGVSAGQTVRVNSLPFRSYYLCWNEWFRDQNLQNSVPVPLTDGGQAPPSSLMPRNKFHDYFTTTLPWTQKFTAPTVPIAGTAPVRGIAINAQLNQGPFNGWDTSGSVNWLQARTTFGAVRLNASSTLPDVFADLSAATGVSINQLRQAVQIQRLLERDARGGTRYAELVLAHFGVRPPDYRVQRPEYIGGGSGMVNVTPVAQTAPVTGQGTVGNLGAAATGVVRARASYAATEHGIILGLISLRPEQIYWQGIRRGFLRQTRYDYYWPSLSQIGEQAVTRQEIFANGVDAEDNLTFGFQERYSEYRQRYSELAGRFRPGVTGTLSQWHTAQDFGSAPVLGDSFVRVDTPVFNRILAGGQTLTTDLNAQFLADILINADHTRPLPMFGTPVGMGRF